MKREHGFYWVNGDGVWRIGSWDGYYWEVLG